MDMESQGASGRRKSKTKKPPPPKNKIPKKRKTSDGPTCSMFLAELTRKLAYKKKQEEEAPRNVVTTIIDNLTNALPVIFSKKSLENKEPPIQIEELQEMAPELVSSNTVAISPPAHNEDVLTMDTTITRKVRKAFKMPKMPFVNSEPFKPQFEKISSVSMADAAVNTGGDHDVATEIAKHVVTLKKISLIAEEFHQKTAKNLKEIVDSVQEDLIKKLEEVQAEQKARQQLTERPKSVKLVQESNEIPVE